MLKLFVECGCVIHDVEGYEPTELDTTGKEAKIEFSILLESVDDDEDDADDDEVDDDAGVLDML